MWKALFKIQTTDWEKYMWIAYVINNLYPEYMKNSQNSTVKQTIQFF